MAGTNVLLLVTGGIAVYKSCLLTRLFVQAGLSVRVAMTDAARHFVSPLTFRVLSGHGVATDLWGEGDTDPLDHVELARWADIAVVAPATANLLAKAAHGIADDIVSTLLLACEKPLVVAPAMNDAMWRHPATQANLRTLRERGAVIVEPGTGFLACGVTAEGRLAEPEQIAAAVQGVLAIAGRSSETGADAAGGAGGTAAGFAGAGASPALGAIPGGFWAGRKVVVTAGPTWEPIDDVRYIANRSTGVFGFAIAAEAAAQGADVTLIAGPTALPDPPGVRAGRRVETAAQMATEVGEALAAGAEWLFMAAAVADFTPERREAGKLKKESLGTAWSLELRRTPDILGDVVNPDRHQGPHGIPGLGRPAGGGLDIGVPPRLQDPGLEGHPGQEFLGHHPRGDEPRGDAPGEMPAPPGVLEAPVPDGTREVRVPRPRDRGQGGVVLGPGVRVPEDQAEGGARGPAPVEAGEDLRPVRLPPVRGARGPGAAAGQVRLEVLGRQGQPGGQAVQGYPHGGAVGLPEEAHPEDPTCRVHGASRTKSSSSASPIGSISTDPGARGRAKSTTLPARFLSADRARATASRKAAGSGRTAAAPAGPSGRPGSERAANLASSRDLGTPRRPRRSRILRASSPQPPRRAASPRAQASPAATHSPWGRPVTASTACPIVCPRLSLRRSPDSRKSDSTIRAFKRIERSRTSARRAGSEGSRKAAPAGRAGIARSSRSRCSGPSITACLTASTRPPAACRAGRVESTEGSTMTKRGRRKDPTRFLRPPKSIPFLPPTEASTMARTVVGAKPKSSPRIQVVAANPARSETEPPPTARTVPSRPSPSPRKRR